MHIRYFAELGIPVPRRTRLGSRMGKRIDSRIAASMPGTVSDRDSLVDVGHGVQTWSQY